MSDIGLLLVNLESTCGLSLVRNIRYEAYLEWTQKSEPGFGWLVGSLFLYWFSIV